MYLSNVETLARKFVEEKHGALAALRADDGGFLAFWASLEPRRRRQMAAVSGEVILKVRDPFCLTTLHIKNPSSILHPVLIPKAMLLGWMRCWGLGEFCQCLDRAAPADGGRLGRGHPEGARPGRMRCKALGERCRCPKRCQLCCPWLLASIGCNSGTVALQCERAHMSSFRSAPCCPLLLGHRTNNIGGRK